MDPRRLALLALLVTGLPSCVGDIDFDAIEPQCDAPNLDSAARDEFCSVTVGRRGELTLPEGEVAMGAHARGDAVALATLANTEFYEEGDERFWFSRELHVYWLQADDIPTLNSISHDDGTHVAVDVNLATTAFDTRVIAERGGVIGMGLINDFYFVQTDGGQVHRNLAGIRYPRGSTPFGQRAETLAYDLDSIEDGDELLVASALSFPGLKVQKFVWDDGTWREVLPTDIALPPSFTDGGPLELRGYELDCRGMTASNQTTSPEWRQECRDRCPKCGLADILDDECQQCRLADTFVLPLGIGAFSVTSITDPNVFFTGGTDIYAFPASVLDPSNWGDLSFEQNETFEELRATQIQGYLGDPIALRNYTLTGESSQTRFALAMRATRDRLYIVAGDTSPNATTEGVDMLIFAHSDGVIDPDIIDIFKLPEDMNAGLFLSIEVQDNGIVTVRDLPSEGGAFGETTMVSYDLLEADSRFEIDRLTLPNEEEYGTHGLAALPDYLLVPTSTGLRLQNSQASGDLLP